MYSMCVCLNNSKNGRMCVQERGLKSKGERMVMNGMEWNEME